MDNIIFLKGKVKYNITLDPGVWIFDDRRIDLDSFFQSNSIQDNTLEEYTKLISKHWDREIMEGSTSPPTLKTEKKYLKEKLLTGSFAIPFEPFLQNAEPLKDAKFIKIESLELETQIPIKNANQLILAFSKNGKPLTEDGPIHVYYRDKSNQHAPIKNVRTFRIE